MIIFKVLKNDFDNNFLPGFLFRMCAAFTLCPHFESTVSIWEEDDL